MSYFFLNEGLLFRSYLPGQFRKPSTFSDQFVVPTSLRKIVINSCHDLPASGGHLYFIATLDIVRDRFWWPIIPTDVRIEVSLSCQHRKLSHRPPKLPAGHRPVMHVFQCIAVDLVDRTCLSQGNRFNLSVIDHLIRFVILIPLKNIAAFTIVRHLIERVLSMFGPLETLHFDEGKELENELVKELQSVQPLFALRSTLCIRACAQHCPQYVGYVQQLVLQ